MLIAIEKEELFIKLFPIFKEKGYSFYIPSKDFSSGESSLKERISEEENFQLISAYDSFSIEAYVERKGIWKFLGKKSIFVGYLDFDKARKRIHFNWKSEKHMDENQWLIKAVESIVPERYPITQRWIK